MDAWLIWTLSGVGVALIAATLGVIVIWLFQQRFLYFPEPLRSNPSAVGLAGVRETILSTPDGETLIVWRCDGAADDAPFIFYLHGNARALARRAKFFSRFVSEGWALAAISHRGFGGSTGKPSEQANVTDALQLYDMLLEQGVDPHRIVVYGESLGSGTAVQVAAKRLCGGLILHAPMDSVEAVAAWRVPLSLPKFMIRDRYRSIDHISRVTSPILWMHGDEDGVIPMRFGRRLYDAASAPRYFALVPGAGHFGLYSGEVFTNHIRLFVNGVVRAAGEDRAEVARAAAQVRSVITEDDNVPTT